MNNDFETYLCKKIINPKDVDFSKAQNCKSLLGQLKECDKDLSAIRLHLKIIFNLYKKGICIYRDDYKDSKKYSQEKDVWISIDDSTIMSTENYIERFLIAKNRLIDIYGEKIYAMGNPHELYDEERAFAENLVRRKGLSDYETEEMWSDISEDELTSKIRTSDPDFISQLCRKVLPESYKEKTTGGIIARLYRDLRFSVLDFPLDAESESEICKIVYLFYELEHEPIIPVLQGNPIRPSERKGNNQYFNLTNFFSDPCMENVGEKFLMDKECCRLNRKITDYIKNELEKEINLKESNSVRLENMRKEFKSIVTLWAELFNTIHNAVDTNQEIDLDQIRHAYYSLYPPFLSYEEIKRRYGFQNPASELHHTENEESFNTLPILELYFRILQFEWLGEISDREKLNSIEVESDYDVPKEFVERMKSYKSHLINGDPQKYIKENINDITECICLNSIASKSDKDKVKYHSKNISTPLECCMYVGTIIKSKDEISKLLIISCLQAILLDERNVEDVYMFYNYQYHLKSTHPPEIHSKNPRLAIQKLYWAKKVEAHWYANLGKYELYRKSKDIEGFLYKILRRICSTDNIDEMQECSMECYKLIEPFFHKDSSSGNQSSS